VSTLVNSSSTTCIVQNLLRAAACGCVLAACSSDAASGATDGGGSSPSSSGANSDGGGGGVTPAPTATSGSDASAPAPSSACSTAGMRVEMIDDMEARSSSIIPSAGRVGAWYAYNDGTAGGTLTPAAGSAFLPAKVEPPRGSSAYAARMTGSGFTQWGAGMAFNLNDPGDGKGGSAKAVYDGSAYTAITFCARAAASTSLRVNLATKDTDATGDVCSPAAKCADHFGKGISLSTDWTQYTIKFSDVAQVGWGQAIPTFNPAQIYSTQFQVAQGATFDVWIDDVQFVLK
jgi:hypothetical protein